MATNNILGYPLPDKRITDTHFRWLFAGGTSGDVLSLYIRENYTGYAVLFTLKKLGISSADLLRIDFAIDIATEVIDSVSEVNSSGKIRFMGTSAFSTYLHQAVSRTISSKRRFHYPQRIESYGLAAMNAYRMYLAERKSVSEVEEYLSTQHSVEKSDIPHIMKIINSYVDKEQQRQSKRPGGVVHTSLDLLSDGRPGEDRSGGFEPVSHHLTPEEAYERKQTLEVVKKAVSKLGEPAKTVITGYVLDERWDKISDMEKELGLKNGTYELKKAKDQLRILILAQNLLP